MAISVEHFGRVYGAFTAVDDLSFDVAAGEIVGLIGPNGAGKTTTLRALAGILRPSSGRVFVDGHDLVADPLEAKRRLAFMPDEPHLFEYLTVTEHLRLVARLYGVADFERRAAALVEELELQGKERSLPGELSRGMRQKVVIACGLVREATTLLFDEPLTGLDPLGIRRMKESITRRAKDGAAVILSSHLLHLVEELCDTVLVIKHGKRVAYGTIDDLKWQIAQGRKDVTLEDAFLEITGSGS
jgi:ABC-2 type transport system ATP-binding protein